MARSLHNAKLLAASVADAFSPSVFRRGYAAAAPQGGAFTAGFGSVGRSGVVVGKLEDGAAGIKEASSASSTWAPDPITGCYRPANCAAEVDPVALREMLLNNRVRPH